MVAGERDPFGTPDEVRAAVGEAWLARNSLVVVAGAGHALVPSAKTMPRADVRTLLTRAVGDFALRAAAGNS
jgi:predicted alpha/beta-hydrolase family hydrolase